MSSVFCLLCFVFVCPGTVVIPKKSIFKEKVIINQQLIQPLVILIQKTFSQYYQHFFRTFNDLWGQRSSLQSCGQSYGICVQKMWKLWSIAIRSYILIHLLSFWSEDDPNSFLDLINPQFDINDIFIAQKPSKIWLFSNGSGAHETCTWEI